MWTNCRTRRSHRRIICSQDIQLASPVAQHGAQDAIEGAVACRAALLDVRIGDVVRHEGRAKETAAATGAEPNDAHGDALALSCGDCLKQGWDKVVWGDLQASVTVAVGTARVVVV